MEEFSFKKIKSFILRKSKFVVITLLVITILLSGIVPTVEAKKISDKELRQIKLFLEITNFPFFSNYTNKQLKKILNIKPEKVSDLTYGILVLSAMNEMDLIDMVLSQRYKTEATVYFNQIVDERTNLVSYWKRVGADIPKVISGRITGPMATLTLNTFAITNKTIAIFAAFHVLRQEKLYDGLWYYFDLRRHNESHEIAWDEAKILMGWAIKPNPYFPRKLDKSNESQLESQFASLWDKWGPYTEADGISDKAKQQVREELRTTLASALETHKFVKEEPKLSLLEKIKTLVKNAAQAIKNITKVVLAKVKSGISQIRMFGAGLVTVPEIRPIEKPPSEAKPPKVEEITLKEVSEIESPKIEISEPIPEAEILSPMPETPEILKEPEKEKPQEIAKPKTIAKSEEEISSPPPKILISEIQTASQESVNDEFIELYNPNNYQVNLSQWSIQRAPSTGTIYKKNFEEGNIILAGGYFLIVNSQANQTLLNLADLTHSSFELTDDNTIFLVKNQEKIGSGDDQDIIDKVGFGEKAFSPEGNPAPNPGKSQSIERKNNQDTNDNSQDFILQSNPNPKGQILPQPQPQEEPLPPPPPSPSPSPPPSDTTPPETILDSFPANPTDSKEAIFSFHSNETGSSFECSLDGQDWLSCTSPQNYSNLTEGFHKFQVRAIDLVGNVDPTPAYFGWIIEIPEEIPPPPPPDTEAPLAEAGLDQTAEINQSLTFDGSGSSDNLGIVSYKWDIDNSNGLNWENPDLIGQNPFLENGYSTSGTYTVTLQVADQAGNIATDTLIVTVNLPPKILISEIQIEGDLADYDFIELYNPSLSPIDISGYQLKKRNQSGGEYSIRIFPQGSIIESYFLWANSGNDYANALSANASSTAYLTQNNSIALFSKNKNMVDALAWGSSTNPFIETSPFAQNPDKNESLGRKWNPETQEYQDTNDNSQDFEIQIPTPGSKNQTKTSPPPEEIISTIATGFTADLGIKNQGRKLARSSGGNLYVVYFRKEVGISKIFLAKSPDKGKSWQELAVTPDAITEQRNPAIALDSNDKIHLVWQGKDSANLYQIRYRKYNGTFQSIENLTNNENWNQEMPVITIDSKDNVHIIWVNKARERFCWDAPVASPQIFHKTSTDNWQKIERIGDYQDYSVNSLAMALDSSDFLQVVWQGRVKSTCSSDPSESVRYQKRTDAWGQIKQLDTPYWSAGYKSSIAIDSNDNLHLVWHDTGTYSDPDRAFHYSYIKYIKYTKNTDSWSEIRKLETNNKYPVNSPSISIDSNNHLYVVWKGSDGGYDKIHQIEYTDSWQPIKSLFSSGEQIFPNLLWSLHPTITGTKTNRPKTGYTFIYYQDGNLKFYSSQDLTWE